MVYDPHESIYQVWSRADERRMRLPVMSPSALIAFLDRHADEEDLLHRVDFDSSICVERSIPVGAARYGAFCDRCAYGDLVRRHVEELLAKRNDEQFDSAFGLDIDLDLDVDEDDDQIPAAAMTTSVSTSTAADPEPAQERPSVPATAPADTVRGVGRGVLAASLVLCVLAGAVTGLASTGRRDAAADALRYAARELDPSAPQFEQCSDSERVILAAWTARVAEQLDHR